jgi:hypothetical protein
MIRASKNCVRKRSSESAQLLRRTKRRNVYKVALACGVVAWLLMQVATLQLFEPARGLVRLDHIASVIVNANHSIV